MSMEYREGVAAGPNRKQLKVKDPLKFNWRPKELLPQLANIYLHLERADAKGTFAHAIAVSDRYRPDMFPETCQVCYLLFLLTLLMLCLIDTVPTCSRNLSGVLHAACH